ncbi:MAG: YgjV family protein [Gammaproteobacteria bacterium]|nr:YgjV family protein [Gammaproteobacteria bacterium]
MSLWLAYSLGTLGIGAEWRSYSLACGQAFRRWSAIGALLWSGMYALLDAWTAALTMATTALRTWLSGWLENPQRKHPAAIGFVLLFIGLTALSWQGPISLLPAFAVINTTLALFYLGNRAMRIALLGSSIAWIANDILWHAWPALLAEVVAAGLNLRTIQRLGQVEQLG